MDSFDSSISPDDEKENSYSNDLYSIINGTVDNDYTVSNSSKPKYVEIRGLGAIFKGELIKNNTPQPVYIFRLDKNGDKIIPGKLLASNRSLTVDALSNTLFQVANTDGECMGILFPKSNLQYVSDVSVLQCDNVSKNTLNIHTSLNNEASSIFNDLKYNITIQWINEDGNVQQDGIVLKPNEKWNVDTDTNYLCKIADNYGNSLGVFLPEENKIHRVSLIQSVNTLGDHIIGTGGYSINNVSRVYSAGEELERLLINDSDQALKVYVIDNSKNESLSNDENDEDVFDIVLPGETWEKTTKSNYLFKVKTEDGKCLGTFIPSKDITKISEITGLKPASKSNGISNITSTIQVLEDKKNDKKNDKNIPEKMSNPVSGNFTILIILLVIITVILGYIFYNLYLDSDDGSVYETDIEYNN